MKAAWNTLRVRRADNGYIFDLTDKQDTLLLQEVAGTDEEAVNMFRNILSSMGPAPDPKGTVE